MRSYIRRPFVVGESMKERRARLARIRRFPNRVYRDAFSPATKELLISNITKNSNGCWVWNLGKYKDGYGAVRHLGMLAKVHRLAYELWNGTIPEGLLVCHHSDNPPCCNPEHLFLGTVADNNADKVRKGRQRNGYSYDPRISQIPQS